MRNIPHPKPPLTRYSNSISSPIRTIFFTLNKLDLSLSQNLLEIPRSHDQNSPRHLIPLCIHQRIEAIRRFIEREYLCLHLHSMLSPIDPWEIEFWSVLAGPIASSSSSTLLLLLSFLPPLSSPSRRARRRWKGNDDARRTKSGVGRNRGRPTREA